MIPKIIHYTWFSNDEMPQKVKDCINSWKKIMPDYELRKWDMASLQEINSEFLSEALAEKKWAYAADLVRLYAIYTYGGIYLDTDVEVYKPFDRFLNDQSFIGKESSIHYLNEGAIQKLSSHCFGAEKGDSFVKKCLDYYEGRHFITSSNKQLPNQLRQNIVTLPYIQACIAHQIGFNWNPSYQEIQELEDGLKIYPSIFFDPYQGKTYDRSKSFCIHYAMGGWRETKSTKLTNIFEKIVIRILKSIMRKFHYELKKYH